MIRRRGRQVGIPGHGERGFTLIELLVSSGIMLSLGLLLMLWVTGISTMWWTSNSQATMDMQAHALACRLTTELSSATRAAGATPPNLTVAAAPNNAVPNGGGNTPITFYLPKTTVIDATGNTDWDTVPALSRQIQYQYVPTTQQLRRVQNGASLMLADHVASMRIDDNSTDGTLLTNQIRVRVTLQFTTPQRRTVTSTAVQTVRLRN